MTLLIQCRTDTRTLRLARAHHALRHYNIRNFFAKYQRRQILWSDENCSFARSVHQYTGNRRRV